MTQDMYCFAFFGSLNAAACNHWRRVVADYSKTLVWLKKIVIQSEKVGPSTIKCLKAQSLQRCP